MLWPRDIGEEPLYAALAEALAIAPCLSPATFGEASSCCIDILALPHNAVRQELCDMFKMYRAMADMGTTLLLCDVKASTLWFRTFSKFVGRHMLTWHDTHVFPWFLNIVQTEPLVRLRVSKLSESRNEVEKLTQLLYAKQARLSAQIASQAPVELIRVQLVDVVHGCVEVAGKMALYLREVESFIAPKLQDAGVSPEDRDDIFRNIVQRMLADGTERIDLPLLVRWMPRATMKAWLARCAIDRHGRGIAIADFNRWQRDYLGERHVKVVRELVQRAENT